MKTLPANLQKPTYNSHLPYIDAPLLASYQIVCKLLKDLIPHESIFYTFQNLRLIFTRNDALFPYKKLLSTIHFIQQKYPDLPKDWRKEIEKIHSWVSEHLLLTKTNILEKDFQALKKAERFYFGSTKVKETSDFIYVKNTYFVTEKEPAKFKNSYTLTGKIKRVILNSPISIGLQKDLKLAHEIIEYVNSCIKYSSNHPLRNPLLSLKNKKIKELDEKIHAVFFKTETYMIFGHSTYYNKHSKKLLELSGLSNCRGMSLLGLLYARKKSATSSVKLVSIKQGDHFFLTINDAIFCDPWTKSYSPIGETDHVLDYIGFDLNLYRPVVKIVPLSQIESIYTKDPFFLLHADQNQIELGNFKAVEEFLELNPVYTRDIGTYNDFLQRALDYSHPEILALFLQKGNPKNIYPILRHEILSFTMHAYKTKSIKCKTFIQIISKIKHEIIIALTFYLFNNYLLLAKKKSP